MVVSSAIFLVSWLVGPGNTIIHWIETKREIAWQEKEMDRLNREIESMNHNIDELRNNKDTLEKFARERFNFAAPGEDVYVIE